MDVHPAATLRRTYDGIRVPICTRSYTYLCIHESTPWRRVRVCAATSPRRADLASFTFHRPVFVRLWWVG